MDKVLELISFLFNSIKIFKNNFNLLTYKAE